MSKIQREYNPVFYSLSENQKVNNLRIYGRTYAEIITKIHYPGFDLFPLKGGHMCELFIITSSQEKNILKIIPYDRLAVGETLLLKRWGSLGLPVPTIKKSDTSKLEIPYAYIVMEYVDSDICEFDHFSHAQKIRILSTLVSYLRIAHTVRAPSFGWINFHINQRGDSSWQETMIKIIRGRGKTLISKGLIEVALLKRFEMAVLEAIFEPLSPILLHGDFTPSNVLYKKAEVAGLIDPDPIGGDGLYDVAYLSTSVASFLERGYNKILLERYFDRELTAEDYHKWNIYRGLALIRQITAALKKDPKNPNLVTKISVLKKLCKEL